MNKKLIALSMIFITSSVFAQQAQPTQPTTEKKGVSAIVDILNSQIATKPKEENKNNQNGSETTNANTTEEINTPSNTGGANYNANVKTGLDDYQTKQQSLKNRIEQLKAEREEKRKQQAIIEENLRREQAILAEQNRLAQEAQARAQAAPNNSGTKKSTPSKQDYHNKQLQIMQQQSF